jgi:hypothetical protein
MQKQTMIYSKNLRNEPQQITLSRGDHGSAEKPLRAFSMSSLFTIKKKESNSKEYLPESMLLT